MYQNTNRLPQAEDYFRQVLELDKKIKGEASPGLAGTYQNLGVVLTRERKFAEAERYLREALAMKQKTFAADHWDVATTKNLLGRMPHRRGPVRGGGAAAAREPSHHREQFGPGPRPDPVATTRVVTLYERWGKPEQGRRVAGEAAATCRFSAGQVSPAWLTGEDTGLMCHQTHVCRDARSPKS